MGGGGLHGSRGCIGEEGLIGGRWVHRRGGGVQRVHRRGEGCIRGGKEGRVKLKEGWDRIGQRGEEEMGVREKE